MKHLLLVLLLFTLSLSSQAQQNLVPNPSFEDTVYCPFGLNQFDACKDWMNFGNSPDYFNSCGPSGLNVPNVVFGYQFAHSGNAMAGIYAYRKPFAPSGPNYREFIGTQLQSPCIIGTKYFISFYINYADVLGIAINKLGISLSTVPYDSCCQPALTNSALLYTDTILKDSLLWVRLEKSFIADSAYKYVVIGNFFDDSNTDTLQLITFYDAAYYYIDDVCVTTDSLYNQIWTNVIKIEPISNISISPNPTKSVVNISASIPFEEIELINCTGQILLKEKHPAINYFSLDLPYQIENGIYLLKISSRNSASVHKLIVQF